MTRNEAAKVLAIIAAPYGSEMRADQAEAWYFSALDRCDFEMGVDIAKQLIAVEEFRPTPAKFNQARSAILRHTQAIEATQRAIAPPATTPEPFDVKATIAGLRAQLAEAKHTGPLK